MKDVDDRYVRLGEAIRRRLGELDRSQRWLGEEVARLEGRGEPYKQSAVSYWLLGTSMVTPDQLFVIERVLAVRPGTLSRMVGFVPAAAKPAEGVRGAIDGDPTLSDMARRALLAAYEQLSAEGG